MPSFAATIDLSTLDGTNGFKLSGGAANDAAGRRVAFVGDMNGDGHGDFIVSVTGSDLAGTDFGAACLIYGGAGGFPAGLDLANLDPTQGQTLTGAAGGFGRGVGGGMDLNDDGLLDLVIGAPFIGPSNTGGAFVVYGQAGGLPPGNFAATALDGTDGSVLTGQFLTGAGWEATAIGDINGDGIDDLGLMGLSGGYCTAFVLFGRDGGFGPTLSLAALDGTDGFKLTGLEEGAGRGVSISGGGDINGDGLGDLIVGGSYGDEGGGTFGAAYVVFGRDTAIEGDFAASLNLRSLDGIDGFAVQGVSFLSNLGYSVAAIGDLNGDGFDDFALGARRAELTASGHGAVYVVFGKDTAVSGAFPADLDLNSLDGSNGFWLSGEASGDRLGTAVAAAGDVNGDGLADLLIGAANADGAVADAGAAYVLFGRTDGFDARINISSLNGTNGFRIFGETAGDFVGGTVSAGDINGDGLSDIIIGAYRADPNGADSGAAYVIFGIQADLTLIGGAPDEAISGKTGHDTIRGMGGSDVLSGLDGDDALDGGDHRDLLYGGGGADDLLGGLGDDLLDGEAGADQMAGGGGDDTYVVDDAGDLVSELAGEGSDRVRAGVSFILGDHIDNLQLTGTGDIDGTGNGLANQIDGNSGANVLGGGGGNDLIRGGLGADTLNGDAGADLLLGGEGVDALNGGADNDRLYGDAADDILSGGGGVDLLEGGAGNDALNGDAGADQLDGGDGADTLGGGADNDRLDGGAGDDIMRGGAGDDIFLVDSSGDQVFENLGEGIDTVKAAVSWALGENFERLILDGAADIDGTGNDLANLLAGNSGANVLDGGGGVDMLNGGLGADTLIGGAGADILTGGAGADSFVVRQESIFSSADPQGRTIETDSIGDFGPPQGDSLDLSAIDAVPGGGDDPFTLVGVFGQQAGQLVLTFAAGITTLLLDVDGDGAADYRLRINGDVRAETGGWLL